VAAAIYPEENTVKGMGRLVVSLVVGCITAFAIAGIGFFLLRALWPAYAVASPAKAYTLAMLFSRLVLGVLCVAIAAGISTVMARDNGRAAWWLGGIFLLVSLPLHLHYAWHDYPAWYHFVYITYLVPIAGLAGQLIRRSPSGA
jgi:hypothetical protein